jgi:hypothetical protein
MSEEEADIGAAAILEAQFLHWFEEHYMPTGIRRDDLESAYISGYKQGTWDATHELSS